MKRIKIVAYRIKSKRNKTSAAPIYVRAIYNKHATQFSTGYYLHDDEWDEKKKQVKQKCNRSFEIKKALQEIEEKIIKIFNDLLLSGQPFSVEKVKEIYETKSDSSHSLMALIQYKIDNLKSLRKAEGTIDHYKCLKNKIARFLSYQYKAKDISLDQITFETLLQFQSYLITICKNQRDTVPKNMSRLKTVLRLGRKLGWTVADPFVHYKISYEQPLIKYLRRDEVQRLRQLNYTSTSMCYIKDLFVFMVHTGLSHCDVMRLCKHHVTADGGKMFITIDRKKTGTNSIILLLPEAKEIIEKYVQTEDARETIFETKSVQHMDRQLKKIAKEAKVTPKLSCHMARHTFATLALENGVPIETVSKSMGHSSIKETQIYARVTPLKVALDFERMSTYY